MSLMTVADVAEYLQMNQQVVQRKLAAGEIPGYRIGKEWRVDLDRLKEWLEEHSNQRARTVEAKVLATFVGADGRLTSMPVQRSKRLIILRWVVERFAPNTTYPEAAVNRELRQVHDDVAFLRRELVMEKLMVRSNGIYLRTTSRGTSLANPG